MPVNNEWSLSVTKEEWEMAIVMDTGRVFHSLESQSPE